jgi:proteasome lid subunit RPN8/RPN11
MVGPVVLPGDVLEEAIAAAQACGAGRNECVLYLTAEAFSLRKVVGYIHPRHMATPASTEVEFKELARVWDELRDTGRTIVCQVHTHPGSAFHSGTDDHYPVVHAVGFPSLVLASLGRRGLDGAYLAVHFGGGQWEVIPQEAWAEHLVIGDG